MLKMLNWIKSLFKKSTQLDDIQDTSIVSSSKYKQILMDLKKKPRNQLTLKDRDRLLLNGLREYIVQLQEYNITAKAPINSSVGGMENFGGGKSWSTLDGIYKEFIDGEEIEPLLDVVINNDFKNKIKGLLNK
jgi:hypothetical protein